MMNNQYKKYIIKYELINNELHNLLFTLQLLMINLIFFLIIILVCNVLKPFRGLNLNNFKEIVMKICFFTVKYSTKFLFKGSSVIKV